MAVFEEFSAGYYVGQLYIEPSDGEHAVMDRGQHEEANGPDLLIPRRP